MKVLLVTQGDPEAGMTGVATYVRSLGDALAENGHEVAHCFSIRTRARGGPRLDWAVRGGRTIAMIANSPLLQPFPPERMEDDIVHRACEALFSDTVRRIRPDVVHIHDLAGLPAGVISRARRGACGVVMTLHDFWPFCRRQFLLRPGLIPCEGSAGGQHCARFCTARPPKLRRLAARIESRPSWAFARYLVRGGRGFRARIRGAAPSQFRLPPAADGSAWPDLGTIGAYAEREAALRERVLETNVLLTVSEFVKSMYVRQGYPESRLRVLPPPVSISDRISFRQREFRGYPIRFGYLGKVSPLKGAHILAEAAAAVPPERARFTLYGDAAAEDRPYLLALAAHHTGMHFAGPYGPDQLPAILEDIDIAILPSLARETRGMVGLEAQAAGLPIIGSDAGALPEYVQHEVNGLLFTTGSAAALRAALLRIIEDPAILSRLSANVRPPERMPAHVQRMGAAYREAVGVAVPAEAGR
jgi:glycosyltransferase involved in cell wall biosynthesis